MSRPTPRFPRFALSLLLIAGGCGDDGSVEDLEIRLAAVEAALHAGTSDDAVAPEEVEALQTQLAAAISRLDALEDAIDALPNGEAELSAYALVADLEDLEASLSALDAEVVALDTSLGTVVGLVNGQGSTISEHASSVAILQTTVASHGATLTAHGAEIADHGGALSSMSTTVSGLEESLTAIVADVGEIDGEVGGLLGATTDLAADLIRLEGVVQTVSDDLDVLAGDAVTAWLTSRTLLVPSQYPTIQAALDALRGVRLAADVTIQIAPGTWNATDVLQLDHPDGRRVSLVGGGAAPTDTVLTTSQGTMFAVPPGRTFGTIRNLSLSGTTGTAVHVDAGAHVALSDLVVEGFTLGVAVSGGSVEARDLLLEDNSSGFRAIRGRMKLTDVELYGKNGSGVRASHGSIVEALRVQTHNDFSGYTLTSGSVLTGTTISAFNSTVSGFEADEGSVLSGYYLSATDSASSAFSISTGSVLSAAGLSATGGSRGISLGRGSVLDLGAGSGGSTISYTGDYGIFALNGAVGSVSDTTITGPGTQRIRASTGAYVNAQFSGLSAADVNPRLASTTDLTGVLLP